MSTGQTEFHQRTEVKDMNFTNLYDKASLGYANRYCAYTVTKRDVEKVNRLIGLIRKAREQEIPMEGDTVEFISRTGGYFGEAHIERVTGSHSHICLIPQIPLCFTDRKKAAFKTEGNPWEQISTPLLTPAGITVRKFHTRRPGKQGSLFFKTTVRKWRYQEADPLYDGYTTQNWKKYHIIKSRDPKRKNGYIYRSDSFTLHNRSELDELVKILHGKLYEGICPDSFVLWGYDMEWREISGKKWNGLGGPVRMNFLDSGLTRILTDDETHSVAVYKISDQPEQE